MATEVKNLSAKTAQAAGQIEQTLAQLTQQTEHLIVGGAQAKDQLGRLLDVSENLIELSAATGVRTDDTRFTEFTDRVLPAIQEPLLAFDERVAFCAAIDLRGYIPTHNLKFSQPQGDDPVWNAAHSRNRRIFDDRTGLGAGSHTKPFLLQTYRRDMGGGQFVMMKDASAPIFVNGRHWGGFRMGYRI